MSSKSQTRLVQLSASFFLLAALFVYPFSVAAVNLFLFLLTLIAIVKTDIIKAGIRICWFEYRAITIGLLLYAALTLIGGLWSDDVDKTLHKIGKQFKWLIIPAIAGTVYFYPQLRKKAFIFLSLGLSLHLIVCTLQYFGIIHISKLGSSMHDAAGLLGHLSFGFIYGIWIGALLVVARNLKKKWAILCLVLAIYATITVFLTHGRSGYFTTIAMISLVIWKVFFPDNVKLRLIIFAIFIGIVSLFFTLHESNNHKLSNTVSGVEAFFNGDWSHVDVRIKIWATSIELWKENPWLGIGTGDYKQASIDILKKPEFAHLKKGQGQFASSHNEFIFNLTRWGPLGLLVTLYLCWAWFIKGWRKDWQNDTMNAYLMTGSGLTVILQGLSEVSLNSQMETTFATIILALAMTSKLPNENT